MVIPDMRLSPVCSARANALRGQRRTADPIPDWLRVSTRLTFHPAGAIVKSCGSDLAGHNEGSMTAACQPASTWRMAGFCCLLGAVFRSGQMLSPSESEAWRR